MNRLVRRMTCAFAVLVAATLPFTFCSTALADPLSGTIELSDVGTAVPGAVFNGIDAEDSSGSSVSSAGDVNGDGLDDLLIGAPQGPHPPNGRSGQAGETYLVYGRSGASALSGTFSLSNADVVFNGIDDADLSGWSVSSAGDVNGDGLDDLLIGAYRANPNGRGQAGETYLVYGRSGASALSGAFELSNADVTFNGIDAGDKSGWSVSSAGDVNGDGLDDLLIGAYGAGSYAGETYLVYGRGGASALSGAFDLSNADVTFNGIDAWDRSGWSVSSAGDVNGDGRDDLLIGAHGADPNGIDHAGETYLVYGQPAIPEPSTAAPVGLAFPTPCIIASSIVVALVGLGLLGLARKVRRRTKREPQG